MKQVALQQKRGKEPLVSLTFKDADTGIPDFMPTFDGKILCTAMNFAIEDFNAGRQWAEGLPMKEGVYLVLMDDKFTVVKVASNGEIEEINNKEIGKITRYMKLQEAL